MSTVWPQLYPQASRDLLQAVLLVGIALIVWGALPTVREACHRVCATAWGKRMLAFAGLVIIAVGIYITFIGVKEIWSARSSSADTDEFSNASAYDQVIASNSRGSGLSATVAKADIVAFCKEAIDPAFSAAANSISSAEMLLEGAWECNRPMRLATLDNALGARSRKCFEIRAEPSQDLEGMSLNEIKANLKILQEQYNSAINHIDRCREILERFRTPKESMPRGDQLYTDLLREIPALRAWDIAHRNLCRRSADLLSKRNLEKLSETWIGTLAISTNVPSERIFREPTNRSVSRE